MMRYNIVKDCHYCLYGLVKKWGIYCPISCQQVLSDQVHYQVQIRNQDIQSYMRILFENILLSLLCLSTLQSHPEEAPPVNYTHFATISNPEGLTNILYAPDYSVVLLYDRQNSTSPLAYSPLTWEPIQTTYSSIKQSVAISFVNATHLIYANKDNEVRLRTVASGKEGEVVLCKIKEEEGQVQKIAISDNGTFWAIFMDNSSSIYWDNLTEQLQQPSKASLGDGMQVRDIEWRPNPTQQTTYTQDLFVMGKNTSELSNSCLYFLYVHKGNSNYTLKCMRRQQVLSLQFIQAIRLFYLQLTPSLEYVFTYWNLLNDHTNSQTLNRTVSKANIIGGFVSFQRVDVFEEIFTLDQVDDMNFNPLFQQPSFFQQSGLSPSGTFLAVYPNTSATTAQIYKLCNEKGYYFDPGSQQCLTCQQPCLECLLYPTGCSACLSDRYYLNNTSHTCLPCGISIPNCLTCSNSSVCTICRETYLLDQNKQCKTCTELIPQCLICESASVCQKCQSSYKLNPESSECEFNWTLILLIGGGVLLAVGVVIGLCVCWKRAKRRENDLKLKLIEESLIEEPSRSYNPAKDGYRIPDSTIVQSEVEDSKMKRGYLIPE